MLIFKIWQSGLFFKEILKYFIDIAMAKAFIFKTSNVDPPMGKSMTTIKIYTESDACWSSWK